MGKDWSSLDSLFSLYKIDEPKEIFFFMKLYENLLVKNRAEEAERKRKAAEKKSKSAGGGKTYTHNVQR